MNWMHNMQIALGRHWVPFDVWCLMFDAMFTLEKLNKRNRNLTWNCICMTIFICNRIDWSCFDVIGVTSGLFEYIMFTWFLCFATLDASRNSESSLSTVMCLQMYRFFFHIARHKLFRWQTIECYRQLRSVRHLTLFASSIE